MAQIARYGSVFLAALFLAPLSYPQDSLDEQGKAPKRYPWDLRPNKCFLNPELQQFGMCKAPADWPDFSTTKNHVDRLLSSQDFELIDRSGREVGLSKAQFPTGDYLFEAWSLSLEAAFRYSAGYSTELAKRWIASSGRNGFSTLAEAYTLYGDAWTARGGGYANTVSPEAWKLYHQNLDAVHAALDSAPEDIRKSGPWQILKLRVVFEHPTLQSQRLAALKSAVSLWPDSVAIYIEPMRLSHPRWGGSFAEMDAIAQFAIEKTRSKWGDAMYALLYERAFRGDPEATLADTGVDWELMKKGFRDLEHRTSGRTWIWRNFAHLACQMRDRDEAARLYAIYDKVRDEEPTETADACREYVKEDRV